MAQRPKIRMATNPAGWPGNASVDDELIERVRRGETEAFAELVRTYQDRVYNTCWRLCGHLEDARDLTQEAFLKAFEGLDRFRQQSSFYTWIFRIAVNLALSHRRSAKRRGNVSLDHLTAAHGTQAEELARRVHQVAEATDPPGALSDAELLGRAAHALHELDEDYRAVVVLRDIEGFDYQQIADILEIPPGTVRSRLHRGRMAIRTALEAQEKHQ